MPSGNSIDMFLENLFLAISHLELQKWHFTPTPNAIQISFSLNLKPCCSKTTVWTTLYLNIYLYIYIFKQIQKFILFLTFHTTIQKLFNMYLYDPVLPDYKTKLVQIWLYSYITDKYASLQPTTDPCTVRPPCNQ